ncbi:MAG: tetratricopeptide repeat protein [Burkholderiales bacterium]
MHKLAKYSTILGMTLWSIGFSPLGSANLGETDSPAAEDVNFVEGKKAVDAQDWNKAIEWLSKAAQSQPQNADVHNYLGYAYRKTGKFPAAFSHYNEALKLNPKHKHAHEYIGEAYLLTDDLFKAEYHLSELQRICSPIPCEEYKDLKREVESYKKTRK